MHPALLYLPIPNELKFEVHKYIADMRNQSPQRATMTYGGHPAAIPPKNGSCPLLERVPAEIRRKIFKMVMPDADTVIQPINAERIRKEREEAEASRVATVPQARQHLPNWQLWVAPANQTARRTSVRSDSAHDIWDLRDPAIPMGSNTINLMRTCYTICKDVSRIMYSEYTFAVHIHPDGVDYYTEPRIQHLNQYCFKLPSGEMKFNKRVESNKATGFDWIFNFCRHKKLKITFFAPKVGHAFAERHASIPMYVLTKHLAELLKANVENEQQRFNKLTVEFNYEEKQNTHPASAGRACFWWNADGEPQKNSTLHGYANSDLILQPFSALYGLSSVAFKRDGVHDTQLEMLESRYETMLTCEDAPPANIDILLQLENMVEKYDEWKMKQAYGITWNEDDKMDVSELDMPERSTAVEAEDSDFDDTPADDDDDAFFFSSPVVPKHKDLGMDFPCSGKHYFDAPISVAQPSSPDYPPRKHRDAASDSNISYVSHNAHDWPMDDGEISPWSSIFGIAEPRRAPITVPVHTQETTSGPSFARTYTTPTTPAHRASQPIINFSTPKKAKKQVKEEEIDVDADSPLDAALRAFRKEERERLGLEKKKRRNNDKPTSKNVTPMQENGLDAVFGSI
ncbi:hypothetical protein M501DRAFT_1016353 [Patellaria atrata CBS 101060]|uniref:Uncharacterized protein n=1 Tax=Patellaria atrata CBS 101060 TaxID=1346257 RepID=A0A9P4SAX0_9PEZI|nr:hypothetical protein M501DRAFT_1016353 [Patellaria atrata CBS 101060]